VTRPRHLRRLRTGLLTAVIPATVFAACSGDAPADRPAPVSTATPVPRPMTPSDSACPRDGRWKACALEDRISKAGLMIKPLDTLTVPYFPERGVRYKIGKTATMAAFYFADSVAGAKATEALDKLRLTPRGDSIGAWPAAPFEAIRSSNLIAVLFDVNATQAERVRLAITAGAPAPYSTQPLPRVDTVRKLPQMEAR
jgi:hypothetical protein